ncbi:lysosomal proton-coupled steroid conjugate and bile acid symporter SLC46A3-like [Tachypleus tridentatus]|uniref:lysosomal proton-coupled steroid conjugate and bile acid symporter SLC46A3-like n=1 Tax=Tachypleus tridentatus TaxID=6853 RepID=UPI003FD5FA0F
MEGVKTCFKSITVEPVLFMYTMAIFLEMSVFQDLIRTRICFQETDLHNINSCEKLKNKTLHVVQEQTNIWIQYYNLVLYTMAIISTLYIGSWSDKFSKKFSLLIPPIGSTLACINLVVISCFILKFPLPLLLISGTISGLCGGTVTMITITFSYLSSITTTEMRTKRMAFLEAMLFTGGTAGFYVGGALLKVVGFAYAFILEICLHVVVILHILFFIDDLKPQISRDSERPVEERQSFHQKYFTFHHFTDVLQTVFMYRLGNRRLHVFLFLLASALLYYGLVVQVDLLFIFLTDDPLNWSQSKYSFISALKFAICGSGLLIGMPVLSRWFRAPDTLIGLIGTLSRGLGLAVLGFSTTSFLVYISALIFVFSEIPIPAIKSALSKLVEPDEKGKIFAFMSGIQNICFLTGSLIFNNLYPATASFFKGFSFLLAALLQLFAGAIFVFIHRDMKIQYTNPASELLTDLEEEND